MWTVLWKGRATLGLMLVLAVALYGGFSGPTEEDSCIGVKIIKETGLTYFCLLAAHAFTGTGTGALVAESPQTPGPPLGFEYNLGQASGEYQFLAHGKGLAVYLSKGGATLELREKRNAVPGVVRAAFTGAKVNANPEAVVEEPLPGQVNYFLGNDPRKWVTDVPTYRQVRYRNVYPGIDVVYYGSAGVLEHDLIVHPGADPAAISMRFSGAGQVSLDNRGTAQVRVNGRRVDWKKPVLYQDIGGNRVPVEGRYRMNGADEVGFEVGRYNPALPLVIDPVVLYASYMGSQYADIATKIAVDAQGNSYVTGFTASLTYASTPGAYVPPTGTGNNTGNIFITKLSAANSAVVYSTYIGGSYGEASMGLAVDATGNVYLTGATESADYPVTPGVIKPQFGGDPTTQGGDPYDCVVTKLNAAGNALVYSTYLGGRSTDGCSAIAVDAQGNAYVTGVTFDASGFPLTPGAAFTTFRGVHDAFIVKLNPTATAVLYGTLLGGEDTDSAQAIAVDAQGAAYITGQTASVRFPATAGALQTKYGGTAPQPSTRLGDAFVAKLSPDGSQFVYVTYLGGARDEMGTAIAVDSQGNAIVAGTTNSDNFPVTSGAVQKTYGGTGGNTYWPGGDAFVAKINSTGSALLFSTYLGGSKDDWATSMAVDAGGHIWVTGATLSKDFPVSTDAAQKTFGGSNPVALFPTGDAWVAELDSGGGSIVYATYLGGTGDDYAMSVAVDASGNTYVAGCTLSIDFPATANAAQKSYFGTEYTILPFGDAFVAKFGAAATSPPVPGVSVSAVSSSASYAGGGVAPGEILFLAGTSIGPATLANLVVAAGKIGTNIGNTQVLFDGTPAPLIYVSATQSSAIVPYAVAGKSSTQLVVVYNGTRSAALTVPVLAVHPALYSVNASGRGQGAILNQDTSYNSHDNPAEKGSIVVLYGTGEGQTDPAGVDGLIALTQFPKPATPVTVMIGGQTADVLYYGAAPQAVAGFLQVNAKVPDNAASGDVEVVIQIGSTKSQSGLTVAVK